MPDKKLASPSKLDPFAEEDYKTKEIRNSKSRAKRRFFERLIPNSEKAISQGQLIMASILIAIIVLALVMVFLSRSKASIPQEDTPAIVNPTGREASSEYTDDTSDPELRASEQEKLSAVLELIQSEDWEYANAQYETIFPTYLDDCGRYDYYRSAILLADNFEGFSIVRETAEERMLSYQEKCVQPE